MSVGEAPTGDYFHYPITENCQSSFFLSFCLVLLLAERAERAEVSRRSAVKFLRARLTSGRLTSPRQPITFPPDAAFQQETS